MRKLLAFVFTICFWINKGIAQSTLTATYTIADLPTSYNVYDPGCSNATLSVTLPAGGSYQVTNTNVEYVIQASGGGNRLEQRSQLVFQNTNTTEPTEAAGSGGAGFQFYNRNTTIGNGIYPGGTVLTFLLQAKRTVEITPGCNTSVQKIVNSSWILTVSYNISLVSNPPLYVNGCSLGDSLSYFSLKGTGSSVIYNPSGGYCNTGPAGFSDYTTQFAPVDIVKGECFTGFMKTGSNDNYATVWIDANDNNLFEDNERILDNLQIGTVKKLYSIYIPTTMNVGIHRLRVRTVYTPLRAIHLTHPVSSYDRGEAEDYLVNIISTPSIRQVAPASSGEVSISSATTISTSSNNNAVGTWVMLMDSSNRYLAGIDAGGGNPHTIKGKVYKHNGPVRQDAAGRYYLDRNIQLLAEYYDSVAYKLRLYFLNTELNAITAQPGSGVTSIFDLTTTKVSVENFLEDVFSNPTISWVFFPVGFGMLSGDRYIDLIVDRGIMPGNFFFHSGSTVLVNGNNTYGLTSANINPITIFNAACGNYSAAQSFQYKNTSTVGYVGQNNAYAPAGFEISFSPGSGFTNTLTIPANTTGTIYTRMNGSVLQDSIDGEIYFYDSYIDKFSTYRLYLRGYKTGVTTLGGTTGSMVQQTLLTILPNGSLFTEPGTCKILAGVTSNGAAPVSGATTTKLWIENNTPLFGSTSYVARHAEILPASNANTATGRVTLYFSQSEFNTFNTDSYSLSDLPTNPADAAGISNLRIYKFNGTSSDGSGQPYTYANYTIINPADSDIKWNAANNYWEVSFNVTGFGHFYTGTSQELNACSTGFYSIEADEVGVTYQWQRNTGSGFTNLTNGGVHLGVTTRELIINSPLTTAYGHLYRCLINGVPSASVYTLKFVSTWLGKNNTNWSSGGNWAACGTVPDVRTDVVIPGGRLLYPVVSGNSSIRSLRNESGSSINIATGVTLTIIN